MKRSAGDMYNLALESGYNIYYATEVFLARQKILGWDQYPHLIPSKPEAVYLRECFEVKYETVSR